MAKWNSVKLQYIQQDGSLDQFRTSLFHIDPELSAWTRDMKEKRLLVLVSAFVTEVSVAAFTSRTEFKI